MHRTTLCSAFLCASLLQAAGNSLGVAVSEGGFLLNQAAVQRNATLLDGAVVETTEAASRLRLTNGVQFSLAAGSRAKVYRDRVVLEKGGGEVLLPAGYPIEAQTLRIAAQKEKVRANVQVVDGKTVEIASAAGVLRVVNASGILVSRVEAGMALAFEPQVAGQGAPSSFVGCLLKRGDNFVVYDETTRMIVDLRGANLERDWGNRVQVNGTARASTQANGNQILDVTSVTRIETGGCSTVAQAIQAQLPPAPAAAVTPQAPTTPTPAPHGGGMSAGTKVAIVAVVAGGGGAGAYLATKSRSK